MIKVAIIEDLDTYREAMQLLIDQTPGMACVGAYSNAEKALEELPAFAPQVGLVDIGLPGMSGIQLVQQLRKASPQTLCLMCTAYDEDEKVFHALEAGAHGYLLKTTAPDKIIEAIHELMQGGAPMSSQVARKVVKAFQKTLPDQKDYSLTAREQETLQLLAKGLLYKEIASHMGISPETVRRHCFNIYEKLHVSNRTEALNKYYNR